MSNQSQSNASNLAKYGFNKSYTYTETRNANALLTINDNGKCISYTVGNFTQLIVSPKRLFTGWHVYYFNDSSDSITLKPYFQCTVNSNSSLTILPNTGYLLSTDGTAFFAVPISAAITKAVTPASNLLEGGGVLTSNISLGITDITGPAVIGRSTGTLGALFVLSTPMLSIITAANTAAVKTLLDVSSLTNNVIQNVTAQASTTIDLNSGHVISLAQGASITTLAFSNVPTVCELLICRTKDNSYTDRTITWPASVSWNEGIAPTLSTIPNSVGYIYLLTVDGGTSWKGLYSLTLEVSNSGKLWSWGYNFLGALGLGDRTDRSSPVQVGNLTNWKIMSSSSYSAFGIKSDGTLWSWGGSGGYGSLGSGVYNATYSSPTQIGNLTDWKYVTGGYGDSVLAIKTDGTLWSWGYGSNGQLGLGDTNHKSSPVQIGSLTNWSNINFGATHALAIKTDGTLWSWGYNNDGQLGLGDRTPRSSPVQISTSTNWTNIYCGANHTLAIKTDGTLWAWGQNTKGQLGLGDVTHRSSPVQIGNLTNWKSISGGELHTLAIKTDGTLWSWGENNYYQLGIGDSSGIPRSSPVQVGSSLWIKTAGLGSSCLAIRFDGTLWAWGFNDYGTLGLGNLVTKSSPVQVGSSANWIDISSNGHHSLAISL